MASSISNSTVFYRKWRPQLFKDVMGQEMLIKTLVQAIIQNRIGHAYLLTGPRGTGKTTTARILAKSINCLTNIPGESSSSAAEGEPCDKCESCESITNGTSMDLIEMDAASNRRIDDIRDLQERVFGAGPSISRSKVYIIDEVHMLTDQSFNALLKTLEEPAPWAHFVLCTTELHKVPATIISRCQKFNLTKIPIVHMENRLNFICNQEEITVQRDVLNAISSASSGSLRDACNMLEQIAIANNNTITKEIIDKAIGANLDPYSLSLVENLIERNIAGGLEVIARYSSFSYDVKEFRKNILSDLRNLLLEKSGSNQLIAIKELSERELITKCANSISWYRLIQSIRIFGKSNISDHGDHGMLPIELAFIECCSISDLDHEKEFNVSNNEIAKITPIRDQKKSNENSDYVRTENENILNLHEPFLDEKVNILKSADNQADDEENGDSSLFNVRSNSNSITKQDWDAICKSLKKFRGKAFVLGSLLYDCSAQFVENDVLTLVFKNKTNLERFKSELSHQPSKIAVEAVLKETLFKSYEIKLKIAETSSNAKAPEGHMVRSAIAMGSRIINEKETQHESTIND